MYPHPNRRAKNISNFSFLPLLSLIAAALMAHWPAYAAAPIDQNTDATSGYEYCVGGSYYFLKFIPKEGRNIFVASSYGAESDETYYEDSPFVILSGHISDNGWEEDAIYSSSNISEIRKPGYSDSAILVRGLTTNERAPEGKPGNYSYDLIYDAENKFIRQIDSQGYAALTFKCETYEGDTKEFRDFLNLVFDGHNQRYLASKQALKDRQRLAKVQSGSQNPMGAGPSQNAALMPNGDQQKATGNEATGKQPQGEIQLAQRQNTFDLVYADQRMADLAGGLLQSSGGKQDASKMISGNAKLIETLLECRMTKIGGFREPSGLGKGVRVVVGIPIEGETFFFPRHVRNSAGKNSLVFRNVGSLFSEKNVMKPGIFYPGRQEGGVVRRSEQYLDVEPAKDIATGAEIEFRARYRLDRIAGTMRRSEFNTNYSKPQWDGFTSYSCSVVAEERIGQVFSEVYERLLNNELAQYKKHEAKRANNLRNRKF